MISYCYCLVHVGLISGINKRIWIKFNNNIYICICINGDLPKHHAYIKNLEKSKMAIVVKFQFEKSKLRIRLYLFNRISVLYSNKEAQRETTCLE
jgi:hypothetical protein